MQLRLGLAGGAAAFCYHAAWAFRERSTGAPAGRGLRFAPASADEALAGRLAPGDAVLFSRDCALIPGLGGALCFARQRAGGSAFDHAGVVVLVRGEPHVLEHTGARAVARRFDARVRASRAREVLVRPAGLPAGAGLPPRARAASDAFLERERVAVGTPDASAPASLAATLSPAAGARAAGELARLAAGDRAANASLDFVARYWDAIRGALREEGGGAGDGGDSGRGGGGAGGGGDGGGGAGGGAMPTRAPPAAPPQPPPLTMASLASRLGQPRGSLGARFGPPMWVRDLRR